MFKVGQHLFIAAILLVLLFSIVQCNISSDSSSQSSDTGTAVISITDAPIDFPNINEINVTMSDIQIRNAETSEITVLQDEPVSLNIMSFRNGQRQIIAGSNSVDNGLYDRLTLQITTINIELTNGDDIDVSVPQPVQDGYSINFTPNVEVVGNGVADILLDFDLYQSFTQQSEGDNFFPDFTFSPVIRYALLGNTGDLSGNIRTENSIILGDVLVRLFKDSQLEATTFTETNGNFAIIGLESGPYTVIASKDGFENDTVDAEITSRDVTEITLIVDSLKTGN